jgi:hypothetical protein
MNDFLKQADYDDTDLRKSASNNVKFRDRAGPCG